jgi:hypothetical protein
MRKRAKHLLCGLLLLTLSTATLAGDSFTAHIPASIAAGNYAEAEMLIAEAVKIGVITTTAAEAYRRTIKQAQERSSANPPGKKQQPEEADPKPETASRQSPQKKTGPDWTPTPLLDTSSPSPDKDGKIKQGRIYVTYTKFNKKTQRYYSGRTSMVIDLDKPLRLQAETAVIARDSNHHIDESEEPKEPAFLGAAVDRFDVGAAVNYEHRFSDMAYLRIRGREQQLIDFHGGAQSDTRRAGAPDRSENAVRAVARDHPLGRQFTTPQQANGACFPSTRAIERCVSKPISQERSLEFLSVMTPLATEGCLSHYTPPFTSTGP